MTTDDCLPLFATIHTIRDYSHYSGLFALFGTIHTIRNYSHYWRLLALFDTIRTIRNYSHYSRLLALFETICTIQDYSHYSGLFAIRDYSLFAIRVFQTPLKIITNKTTEANFTCPLDHQTSIFTCRSMPKQNWPAPGNQTWDWLRYNHNFTDPLHLNLIHVTLINLFPHDLDQHCINCINTSFPKYMYLSISFSFP